MKFIVEFIKLKCTIPSPVLKELHKIYNTIIGIFAPNWFKHTTKSEDIVFVPVVIITTVITGLFLLLYNVYFLIITPDNYIKIGSNLFGLFLVAGIAYWIKKSRKSIITPVLVLQLTAYALICVSVYSTGGIYSIDILWLIFILIMVVLFIGIGWGLIFNLLLSLIVIAFYLFEVYEVKDFASDFVATKGKHELFTLLFLQLFIFLTLGSFSRILKQTRKELDEASQIKIHELDQMVKQQTNEIEGIRNKIARDFHDEFGNKLAGISMTTYVLQEKLQSKLEHDEEINALFAKLDQDANTVYSRGKDFIYSIRNARISLKEIYTYIKDFGDDLFYLTEVDFVAASDFHNEHLEVEAYELILTLKEILTNAFKHAKASRIFICLTTKEHVFEIIVTDNGKGFDTNKKHKGFGLENIADRIEKMNGELLLSSNQKGTSYRIKLPIGK